MRADRLINAVLAGVLGSRGKKARKAARYLTGRRTRGGLSGPATLLGAAGLAWGVIEPLRRQASAAPADSGASSGAPPPASPRPDIPPPLPAIPAAPGADTGSPDAEALRLVRLAVSAATADGEMNEAERAVIVRQAIADGLGEVVERELARPRPLSEVISGVTDPEEAATLYVLAFTILRADEQVTGAERIYLARLAQALGLDPVTVQALEVDTGARIDALGDQGQPGG